MSLATLILLKVIENPKNGPLLERRCYGCKHAKDVAESVHISCAKPCAEVTGSPHGIKQGWFMYPLLFDPVWMTTPCMTFEQAESVNPAVSDSVSREKA